MTTVSTFVMLMASFDPALTARTVAEVALLLALGDPREHLLWPPSVQSAMKRHWAKGRAV